jgi:hypothetical protein
MNTTEISAYTIEYAHRPAAFYEQHAAELDDVGADAFAQPVAAFGPQVAERFAKAALAQVMRSSGRIVGFGLFDTLKARHWRRSVY